MSDDFIKAEDKYRREVLRDQYQDKGGNVGITAALILVAAMIVAACGTAVETGTGTVSSNQAVRDVAPVWEPNHSMLDSILEAQATVGISLAPPIEFGGMAAPSWQPDFSKLEKIMDRDEETQAVGNTEPSGTPNYALLERIVGAEPASGPR
ncbi:MAG TPA: hypothetical protein VF148_04720 [Acidimicrobiia bacterium]